jgi:hypothetical protein
MMNKTPRQRYLNMRSIQIDRILSYENKLIRTVRDSKFSPAVEALQWHNEHIFLG